MTRFDLQCHSTFSDGALPPAEVMERAAADGVELVALSDHDTVDGVPEAMEAAGRLGMRYVRASEISSVEGEHTDLHILGYEIDHTSPDLLKALEEYRDDRQRRTEEIADRLEEFGFEVDRAPLEERRAKGLPIGRPHIADTVLDNPANREKLLAEGITDKNSFFPAYIVPGAKAFVQRSRPTVEEAVDVIHKAGGVAIWAHPFWDLEDAQEVLATIERFKGYGIDGVEVFYPTHSADQARVLHEACTALGLLKTGSTDFHSPSHKRFDRFLGFDLHGLEPDLGPIGS